MEALRDAPSEQPRVRQSGNSVDFIMMIVKEHTDGCRVGSPEMWGFEPVLLAPVLGLLMGCSHLCKDVEVRRSFFVTRFGATYGYSALRSSLNLEG